MKHELVPGRRPEATQLLAGAGVPDVNRVRAESKNLRPVWAEVELRQRPIGVSQRWSQWHARSGLPDSYCPVRRSGHEFLPVWAALDEYNRPHVVKELA